MHVTPCHDQAVPARDSVSNRRRTTFRGITIAAISASLVKELRERTGLGMMECKKALTEADGDIETAIENLRKNPA